MDKLAADVLLAFETDVLIQELRKRGNKTNSLLIAALDDYEIISAIYDRGLDNEFIEYESVQEAISEASDQQIIDEFEDRGLDEPMDNDFEKLFYLIHQGAPYEAELRNLIYEKTGRIL